MSTEAIRQSCAVIDQQFAEKDRRTTELQDQLASSQNALALATDLGAKRLVRIEQLEAELARYKPKFTLWDATAPGYLTAHGLPRLKTPSEGKFLPNGYGAPDLDWLRANAVANMAGDDPLVIDVEIYGGSHENPDDVAVYTPKEIGWLASMVKVFTDADPKKRVAVYMVPPERYGGCSGFADRNNPIFQARWENWTERNALMTPLVEVVWALCPSLYGLYSNMEQWARFAQQNVEQSRMIANGKPVIGYLWPVWHRNAARAAGGKSGPIGYDDWMFMLETCFPICDGIAIWNHSTTRFDPQAPYWLATVDFCKAKGLPITA